MSNKKKLIILISSLICVIITICIFVIIFNNSQNKENENILENTDVQGILVDGEQNYNNISIMTSQSGDVGITVKSDATAEINEAAIESEEATAIHSTGIISLINSYAISKKSPAIVIENNGQVNVDTSDIVSYGKDNEDGAGIILYGSDNNSENTGKFTCVNSMLSIDSNSEFFNISPMFLVKNTKSEINIENTILTYGSGILLKVQGENSEVTVNAKMQNIEGNIIANEGGIININLENETNYMGAINKEDLANEVNINISGNSLWMVTDDTYITTITVEDKSLNNIMSGGNNIYYDASNEKNAWLEGQTILLNDGGYLMPKE